jgi:hypothetical protein
MSNCTLNSDELIDPFAVAAPDAIAIAGTLQTEKSRHRAPSIGVYTVPR